MKICSACIRFKMSGICNVKKNKYIYVKQTKNKAKIASAYMNQKFPWQQLKQHHYKTVE